MRREEALQEILQTAASELSLSSVSLSCYNNKKERGLSMSSVMQMPGFDTDYIRKTIIQPLDAYEKTQNSTSLKEIQDAIRIAQMMVSGFRDILDQLNFDEEKLRTLQYSLDDNYDTIDAQLKQTSDPVTREMIDKLLTHMAKLDMEIGDLILEHRHEG
jgi:hypothetical protein